MRRLFPGLLMALLLLLPSCARINTGMTDGTYFYPLEPFTGVKVGDDVFTRIYVQPGEPGIEITCDENLRNYIYGKILNGVLHFGIRSNVVPGTSVDMEVRIYTDSLSYLEVTDNTRVGIYGDVTGDLEIKLTGHSNVRCNSLDVDNLTISATGGGAVLKGKADKAVMKCFSGASVMDFNLSIEDLVIYMSGASRAELTVNNTINADLRGGSTFTYRGDAYVQSEKLSGGSVLNKE
ncbi:MAG: DUF2807 domain-containing protein [Bacteroidales bacterium]|jgi:hypothetical protein|nr:DUF2807 domain-containing protein [Bacteroidales bacterium]HPH53614.1 DUF2807 domain-containing protein [Bacteroidales bacterium]